MDEKSKNFYANAVNMSVSLYDVTFVFRSQSPLIDDTGQLMQNNGQPLINVSDELVVRMSPQHAKALASLLVKNVIAYEKQFNLTLPLPPEIEQFWKENLKGSK